MTTPAPTKMPTRIGRYEILERLAIGGMAEVYLACERGPHGFHRLVVVKRILPHLAHHEQMVRMFLQEARIAARINHPNVVQILELGEEGGYPFIVMEYVAGSTLRELAVETRRTDRTIPVGVALHFVQLACAGAHAAHELRDPSGKPAGLVHRDLSPHNLMVDTGGHVKVLDFGIAKAGDDADHTRTGVLKGKLRYMSPEQCHQQPLDRRSDVFTLGIVLWELLAGQRLFDRTTELATMQAIVGGDIPDLRKMRPEVPEAIHEVITTALSVDRDARYPTADAMRRSLVQAAGDAGLMVSQDVAAAFVESVLGPKHMARQAHVEEALERSMPRDLTDPGAATVPTGVTSPVPSPIGWMGAAGAMAAASVTLLGLSVALVGVAWWKGTTADATVEAPTPVLTGPPVVIGLAPVHDPAVMVTDYEPIRRWLEARLQRPVKVMVASSYADAGRMLAQGDVHFGVLPPYVYVSTVEEHPEVELLATKQFDGSSGTDGVLLVAEESTYKGAADLRGKTVCFTDLDSSTGYLLPRAWLRDQGVDPTTDVQARMSGNHFQAMRDLETGLCDAAGTYSGAWLTADRAGVTPARMRVLAITGRTPHDAFCAGPAADEELRETVRDALVGLSPERDLGIARVGEAERITGFAPGQDQRFDELRRALQSEK
jgi:phosphate/phosphite/phosphonate ABC transporter binding protein